ncbi:hypothetical protein BJB45_19335 [Halomonas huangheensis]|uniref:Uncharacterized protein n=1 Tax=Halomonas huangheensis TaxID=1178482 RepID=W1N6G7_9GAMM|nr:hypothetical protein BJB45_19335 [Halomonas huangheensis]
MSLSNPDMTTCFTSRKQTELRGLKRWTFFELLKFGPVPLVTR